MVPVIIDIPEEAIVVLIDVSGSMDDLFYDCKDMARLGAVKRFSVLSPTGASLTS